MIFFFIFFSNSDHKFCGINILNEKKTCGKLVSGTLYEHMLLVLRPVKVLQNLTFFKNFKTKILIFEDFPKISLNMNSIPLFM